MRRQTAILLALVGAGVLVLMAGVGYFVWNDFQDREARAAFTEWEQLHEKNRAKLATMPTDIPVKKMFELAANDDEISRTTDRIVDLQERWGRRWDRLGLKWRAAGHD